MKKIIIIIWLVFCLYLGNRVGHYIADYSSFVLNGIDVAIRSNKHNNEEIEKLKARVLELETESIENDPELTNQEKAYLLE